jgi:hypothetical protein
MYNLKRNILEVIRFSVKPFRESCIGEFVDISKVCKTAGERTQEGQLQNNNLKGCISPRHQGVDWINCAHYRD